VAALKADPTKLRIAVAPALGQNIHMAIAKPLHVAGVAIDKLTIAPFRSSGESVTALIGGHVDVVSATAPVVLPQVAAGKLRMLASAAREPGSGPLAQVSRPGANRACRPTTSATTG
jgi:putative tricarboxylic transport membrane protein